ncbi:MAG: metabolite traffic protein EboE [Methylacidiphilales bacterium]|nr:metabolite traffic protein EboE [Candidatus Methylacidiphilales bacterium]
MQANRGVSSNGMQLKNNWHLAYCTNIHRGDDWAQTLASLQTHALAVRERISPDRPYAIGLRLSDLASRQLSEPQALDSFRRWLQQHHCYVFTINGFPYGRFHGGKVKEQVYRPDWTHPDRLAYTNRLFDLLAHLLPEGVEGSVSTLPGSFKEFVVGAEYEAQIRQNLWKCIDHIERCSLRHGRRLSLALEPEPLGLWETSAEIVRLFREMEADRPGDPRLRAFLGVNYDACHLAVEYEEPAGVIAALREEGIRIGKIHLSSALQIEPDKAAREWLRQFADGIYLHQVIARTPDGSLRRYKDLSPALEQPPGDLEWRIHFHVPLYAEFLAHGRTTALHLLGLLDILAREPALCSHFEIETYTWEVLPEELRAQSVVEQLVREYGWCLDQFARRGVTRL